MAAHFSASAAPSQRSGALFTIPSDTVDNQNARCRYVPFPDARFCWDVCLVRNQTGALGKGAALLWEYIENRFTQDKS